MTTLQKLLQMFGVEILPDNKGWINRIRIKGKYIIAQRKNLSEWGCSCPSWVYDTAPKSCKHVEAIIPAISTFNRVLITLEKKGLLKQFEAEVKKVAKKSKKIVYDF